jgi:transcriptional regulator with XRE-family HTH domain
MGDSIARSFPQGKIQAKPGAVLKRLRAERGWTLGEVSERTGLSISTLSKVENDKIALTFEKLVLLSQGLQIDIAQLFGSPTAGAPHMDGGSRRSVTRAGEGRSIETPKGNYLYVAAELINKQFTPIIGDVFAKDISEYEELSRHRGEEFVYVLQGTLELHTEMYTPVVLRPGDSVYFDSGMGHAYIALGDEPCRILSICGTPESQLRVDLEGMQGDKGAVRSMARIGPQSAPAPTPEAEEAGGTLQRVSARSKRPEPKGRRAKS